LENLKAELEIRNEQLQKVSKERKEYEIIAESFNKCKERIKFTVNNLVIKSKDVACIYYSAFTDEINEEYIKCKHQKDLERLLPIITQFPIETYSDDPRIPYNIQKRLQDLLTVYMTKRYITKGKMLSEFKNNMTIMRFINAKF